MKCTGGDEVGHKNGLMVWLGDEGGEMFEPIFSQHGCAFAWAAKAFSCAPVFFIGDSPYTQKQGGMTLSLPPMASEWRQAHFPLRGSLPVV
jgi:hypothetical protein